MNSATTTTTETQTAACIECGGELQFRRSPRLGQVVMCSGCGVELEVVSTSPLALELAPEVEEDWGE